MTKKLNFLLVFTQVFDNTMFFSLFSAFFYFMSNDNLTPLKAYLSFNILLVVLNFHDFLYRKLFSNQIAKAKVETPYTWDNLYYFIKLISVVYGISIVLFVNYGILDFEYKSLPSTIGRILLEYWVMSLGKDFTMMKFIHPLMHTPKWYFIHELHHTIKKDTNVTSAMRVSFLDLIIENVIGVAFIAMFNTMLYGTYSVHLLSFFYLVWTDALIHSNNPYSAVFANPILDYLMKPNVEHNLHHILLTDYYMINSYQHLFVRGKIEKDIALYNELLETKFSYDLFIE